MSPSQKAEVASPRRNRTMETIQRQFRRLLAALMVTGVVQAASVHVAVAAPPCTAQEGQGLIDSGLYDRAVREFSCVIDGHPTDVEGYRGRIEAELLLSQFSNAVRDYTRVTALVGPVHPDAESTIYAGYASRLAADPGSISALTGLSFAQWWFFDYAAAIKVSDQLLLLQPNNVYANTFNASSRLLKGVTTARGVATLDRALALAPQSPDVHYIAADAYTYGISNPQRALAEATT